MRLTRGLWASLVCTAVFLTGCQLNPQLFAAAEPLPTLVSTLEILPNPPTPALTTTPVLATMTSTAVPPTLLPTETPTPTITLTPSYHLALDATQPQGYLSQFRLVAFYGSPTGPGLGILGELPREQMHQRLLDTIADYEPFSDRPILPTYHLVTTVANPHPPFYFHRVDLDLIERWVEEAKVLETAVILDVQPGRGDIMAEFERLEHLLYEPHVHFAIDPEFVMNSWQVPLVNVGQLHAAEINAIQARMNAIGAEIGLNRVLILHQFSPGMLPDKWLIEDYPHVEILIDGDGVGAADAKIGNYTRYASEPAFEYGGFKLFPTDGDYPVLTPTEVMSLEPQPVLIIYQ
ncbi:MAG: hypothetical protein KC433_27285 [Anaerolineales bacterium]|nr:hypothetical protein [Anaerolineales bacterium]MCB8940089.1 hypothetical protein [Ardenticatenaceae bacterium]